MSAIAGIVRFSGAPLQAADLEAAAGRMAELGVDGAVRWIENGVALLVCQRHITHEDRFERQPWTSGESRSAFIYDGRLDNRDEIASALGISLRGEAVADGRLLFAALEKWGTAALPRLVGDFALALWDAPKRTLILARDQLGRRTLYYHQGQGFVAFATSYRALLALPGVPRQLDELGMADFLILNIRHPVETFYREVRRVPAATAAHFNADSLRFERYWTLEPKARLHLSSDADYAEAAYEHLQRAVACRLRAKDGVASALSGGLDSSSVAATAAKLLAPGKLVTVTSVPPEGLVPPKPRTGWYNDERPYIAAIKAMYPNMDSMLASSDQPHWIETDPTLFFAAGGFPARNITNIGWLLPGYYRVKAAGIRVLLTGEGGNPGWSYDGLRTLNTLFRNGHWLHFARELRLGGRTRPYGFDGLALLRREVLRPLEPVELTKWRRSLGNDGTELWSGFSAIHPVFARDIGLAERCRLAGHHPALIGPNDALAARLHLLRGLEHGRDIFTALRALSGIETRTPLLDVRLLEFCLSLPDAQFLCNGEFRRLPRRAMAGRLPVSVLENRLIGSQNPEIMLRMAALRPKLAAEIDSLKQIPAADYMLDLARLAAIVRDWRDVAEITQMLPRALHVGYFLRWAGAGNL